MEGEEGRNHGKLNKRMKREKTVRAERNTLTDGEIGETEMKEVGGKSEREGGKEARGKVPRSESKWA